jgi:hypothetical protein
LIYCFEFHIIIKKNFIFKSSTCPIYCIVLRTILATEPEWVTLRGRNSSWWVTGVTFGSNLMSQHAGFQLAP